VLLLNKVLPLFVLPFGVVCLLVILAVWRKQWWPGLLALVVIYVSSVPFTSELLTRRLECGYAPTVVTEAGPADAVIVLGGILGPSTPPGAVGNWSESVERYEAGVALVQAGRVQHLVFTGAQREWRGRPSTEGAELARFATARGVPPERIVVTRLIDNTAGEATAVAELLRANGWKRVILVTSAWHMPRAEMLFRKAGVDCIPFAVDFHSDPGRSWRALDFIPSGTGWMGTEFALREWYGYAFYRLFR
jgi:uncharacterized SAM-binding protein YcdF (DUF218 family)